MSCFSHHVLLCVLTTCFFAGVLKRHQTVQCLKKCCVHLCTVNCSVARCTMGANELSGLCDSFLYIVPNFMSDCHAA